MDSPWYVILLGVSAQILFSARIIIQWLLSEKANKVVSPTIYWQLSLLASLLFSIYGWMRIDFSIILGQFLSYYIYIWNLHIKNNWKKMPLIIRIVILFIPLLAIIYVFIVGRETLWDLFDSRNIPRTLLILGSVGQVVFALRFVYQWAYSFIRKKSVLPSGFWIISLLGSSIIITYGIFQNDWVLILGHGSGFIIYSRNLWLTMKQA